MRLFPRQKPETPWRRQSSLTGSPKEANSSQREYTFRRGRTLTGSSSPVIFSTNEHEADLKSPRVHAHMLSKKRRRLGTIFLMMLMAASVFFVLISQFTARVVVQATPDPSLQLDDRYEKEIAAYLSENPAQRLRFSMDTEQLSSYLKSAAPEVKSVDVVGSAGFGASLFSVGIRQPIASWDVRGDQLYVDESGEPFNRNYFSSPTLTVTDRSGIPVAPGQVVASARFMGFVGEVIGYIKARGYEVTDIVIPPGMTRQIEVRVKDVKYPTKLSSDRPAGEGVEDMVRAIGWMKSRNQNPEYVDVRVKGKVFYR